eukprot:TRINITY_DN25545_c0_g1_i1.p1 TRINITY_DN25545_c0_g1~~TRINITY_DN25545_c0_g1_i1.p1  ORF type:complete len:104 (-),score=1.53 TRINITY_DN25545_c0_g1_i1:57-368(-)
MTILNTRIVNLQIYPTSCPEDYNLFSFGTFPGSLAGCDCQRGLRTTDCKQFLKVIGIKAFELFKWNGHESFGIEKYVLLQKRDVLTTTLVWRPISLVLLISYK